MRCDVLQDMSRINVVTFTRETKSVMTFTVHDIITVVNIFQGCFICCEVFSDICCQTKKYNAGNPLQTHKYTTVLCLRYFHILKMNINCTCACEKITFYWC